MFQGEAPRPLSVGGKICTNSSDWCQSPHLGAPCGRGRCLPAPSGCERVESGAHVSACPLGEEGELVGSDDACVCVTVSVCV